MTKPGARKDNFDDETDDECIFNLKRFVRRDHGGTEAPNHAVKFVAKRDVVISSDLGAIMVEYANAQREGIKDRMAPRFDEIRTRFKNYRATIAKQNKQITKYQSIIRTMLNTHDRINETIRTKFADLLNEE